MLHPVRFALAGAILWSLSLFVITIISLYTGYAEPLLDLMVSLYPGYSITGWGSVIGFLYGFVDAFIGLWLFAWLYNYLQTKA